MPGVPGLEQGGGGGGECRWCHGGAIDSPAGCSGSDADGVGAVAAVLWSLVHRGLCLSMCW